MRHTIVVVGALLSKAAVAALQLDYATPAATWNEALPLGNGRIGAMVFGTPGAERLQINEDTIWAGAPNDPVEPRLKAMIPRFREKILRGDAQGARDDFGRMGFAACKTPTSLAYQTFGSMLIKFPGHEFPQDYRRALSLDEAVAHTSYRVGDVRYKRECFTSLADDVLIVRLRASGAATEGTGSGGSATYRGAGGGGGKAVYDEKAALAEGAYTIQPNEVVYFVIDSGGTDVTIDNLVVLPEK